MFVMTRDKTKMGKKLKEVTTAGEFKQDFINSSVIKFENDDVQKKLMKADDDELVVVTSTINSPKTVKSVTYYEDELDNL